ncbi:MAG: hypothetical protein BroJett011_42490 [Chloroflexota bacterium]|nr:MAG: hypothetical protein BroJett011_42490 [Chloroflexota bacterium]
MNSQAGPDKTKIITVKGLYLDEYEAIVKPHQAFLISNYFIRYWLRRLETTLGWIIMSLLQACWRANEDEIEIDQRTIAEEIGLDRRTVGRQTKDNAWYHWFLPKIEENRGEKQKDNSYKPLPKKYHVYLSIPLIPEHLAGLYVFFQRRCSTPATAAKVEQALDELYSLESKVALALLESYAAEAPRQFEAPLAFKDLLELATGFVPEKVLPKEKVKDFNEKISQTYLKLVDIGYTDCRQYFRRNWVPLLGSSLAWLIMALRSQCFYNPKTGELRDTCTWQKGALAGILGQTPKNLTRLLENEYTPLFFEIIRQNKREIEFKVRMIGEPLIPDDFEAFWTQRVTNPEPDKIVLSPIKNQTKCDMTPSKESDKLRHDPVENATKCDMTLLEESDKMRHDPIGESDKTRHNLPANRTKHDMTPQRIGQNVTHESTLKDSVLFVVDQKSMRTSSSIEDLLHKAGLSGGGLKRLCDRNPPLDQRQVRAVLLYAEANQLGPGYIYNHLDQNIPVDELFLRFADLNTEILTAFQQAVKELRVNGGRVPSEIFALIPGEHLGLFAQFAEVFVGVKAELVIQMFHHGQMTADPPELADTTPSLGDERAEAAATISLPQPPDQPEPAAVAALESDDLERLWCRVLEQLQSQMTRATFDTWIKDTRLIGWDGTKFTIAVKSQYALDWLKNRLAKTIERTLRLMMSEPNYNQHWPEMELEFVSYPPL